MDAAAAATALLLQHEQIKALTCFGGKNVVVCCVVLFLRYWKPVLSLDYLVTKAHSNKYILLPLAPIRNLELFYHNAIVIP